MLDPCVLELTEWTSIHRIAPDCWDKLLKHMFKEGYDTCKPCIALTRPCVKCVVIMGEIYDRQVREKRTPWTDLRGEKRIVQIEEKSWKDVSKPHIKGESGLNSSFWRWIVRAFSVETGVILGPRWVQDAKNASSVFRLLTFGALSEFLISDYNYDRRQSKSLFISWTNSDYPEMYGKHS